MYVGHAAAALAFRTRAPDVPMLAVILASYGPDILETASMFPYRRAGSPLYTHSILAVLIGACLAAIIFRVVTRRRGALVIAAAWAVHLPLDLVTGRKPLWSLAHLTGLDLYHVVWADVLVEFIMVAVACYFYARKFAPGTRERRIVLALMLLLLFLQVQLGLVLAGSDTRFWHPSLALVRGTRHFSPVQFTSSGPGDVRTPLALDRPQILSERNMERGVQGIVTLVCLTCGKERFFTEDVPARVVCDQCGGSVFRTFATPTEPDGAAIDAAELQARSMAYGDSSPETTADDVRDLGNL